MPAVGLGLHFIFALFFAVHAVRTGREMYWLIILFSFPIAGSVVYFFAVYLPHSRLERGAGKAVRAAANLLDPERELREAREAYDLSPSAQNQWRLADALLARGEGGESLGLFDAALAGPLGHDPALQLAAARAKLTTGNAGSAVSLLQKLRQAQPQFRPEAVSQLLAESLAAVGRRQEAQIEFADAVARWGSVELRCAYAIFAAASGDLTTANAQRAEVERAQRHWNRHARDLHAPMIRRVDDALRDAARATAGSPG